MCSDGDTGKLSYNVPGKSRMKMRTHRILTRKLLLSDELPSHYIQDIGDKINSILFVDNGNAKLLHGSDITDAYEREVGGHSCMTDNNACFTRLYADNDDYRMLTMWSHNNSARAMVIELDKKRQMWDYAKEKGWYYRASADAGCYDIIGPDGDEADYSEMYLSDLTYENGSVPYQDTLIYGYINSSNKLCLMHPKSHKYPHNHTIESTEGYIEDGYCCECCGSNGSEDDGYCGPDGSTYCCECFHEHYAYCDRCDTTVSSEEMSCINDDHYMCDNCRDNVATQCRDCYEWVFDEDIREIQDTGRPVCESCSDNYDSCSDCGEYFSESLTETDEGDNLCEDCISDNGYTQCVECETWTQNIMTAYNDEDYCPECAEELEVSNEEEE
jgi:hypothetical protein